MLIVNLQSIILLVYVKKSFVSSVKWRIVIRNRLLHYRSNV